MNQWLQRLQGYTFFEYFKLPQTISSKLEIIECRNPVLFVLIQDMCVH